MLEFTFWFSITLFLPKQQLLARKQLFLKDNKLFTITHIYNSLRDGNLLEGTIPSCDPDRELASYIMSDSTQSGRHSKLAVCKHITVYLFTWCRFLLSLFPGEMCSLKCTCVHMHRIDSIVLHNSILVRCISFLGKPCHI